MKIPIPKFNFKHLVLMCIYYCDKFKQSQLYIYCLQFWKNIKKLLNRYFNTNF